MREKNGLVYLAAVCIASATITACAGVDLKDKVATSLVATESNATKSSIDEAVSSLSVARPERLGNIKLAEYRNLAVSIPSIAEITDIDVNDAIRNRLKTKATFVNEVQTGDTVNIDFNGKIDGNEFDGGNAEGYELEIGSGAFIDGFEDSLIGMKNGETKDVSLTFPSDYSNEELAGKDVIFTVTVNEIKRIPELTDALAKELDPSCDGVEDYKKKVLSELVSDNDFSYMRQKGYAALEELESLCQFDYRYDLTDFMKWAYQKHPSLWKGFENYRSYGHGDDALISNSGIIDAFENARNINYEAAISDELEYMRILYWDSLSAKMNAAGFKLSERHIAVSAALFSVSVNCGTYPDVFIQNLSPDMSDVAMICGIYKIRNSILASMKVGRVEKGTNMRFKQAEPQLALDLFHGYTTIDSHKNYGGGVQWSGNIFTGAVRTTEILGQSTEWAESIRSCDRKRDRSAGVFHLY